ncbi:MAG: EI24 domain-containing protein [Propionivibrio sp.]|nr:EI24 domain-containing protein [Propionivibrio sp.]MBP7525213.1 EI24 domain-containing protein [Propionivibrio sp.]MBP8162819.1 EI24 domain-containing protein [Propionivibrio sp.]
MGEIMLALQRSLASFGRGKIWLYILVPALIAFVLMVGLSIGLLGYLIDSFIAQPPMSWVADWGAVWLAKALAALGGWLLILSASYMIAVLLTAILVLPLMLNFIAERDYPDLARLGSDSLVESTRNSVGAAVLFAVGWVLTLPLWLIPGLGLLLPLLLMAWLNRRTFAYDVLAAHTTPDEWRALRKQQAMPLLMLGMIMAALTHIPFVGLLAPSLAALAYIHFCLEALRRLRQGAVVTIIEKSESSR